MTQKKLNLHDTEAAKLLYGDLNRNLEALERAVGVKIGVRGGALTISGSDHEVAVAEQVTNQLYGLICAGYPVYPQDVVYAARAIERAPKADLKEIFLDEVYITARNRLISPKGPSQKLYIDAIRKSDIVFGIGPAGTGKTYLAVAMAVAALTSNRVRTIILTRPAVEAGERLGFLPGDLAQKVNPYLRPLHDALNDMLGHEKAAELTEQGIIEIAPLAFMRGRTLNNAFVILDEAQNTSREQMKMFLTRLGFNSKAVVTGDITQIDLPTQQPSGLIEASKLLQNIDGIDFAFFTDADVVRHPLVQDIIRAYEKKTPRARK
ncbi:MAG: PhoH family protein [Desulfobulbaceae bacterium]|nr:PhoH family protein [Desulfobulbaceae bacterium]